MKNIQGCPYHSQLAQTFKPFDLTEPFPFYKQSREEEPIFFSEELGYYVVSRFEDIKAIFGNWKVFASENAQQPLKPILPKAKALMDAGGMVGLSGLSGRIPPDHTRIRRIVSMAFNLGRIRKLEPRIRALAVETIEKIQHKGEAEMIRELAYDLPTYVIFMLLGVPNDDVQKVKSWAESRLLLTWGDLSEDEQLIHAENMVRYWDYCQAHVQKCKESPSDDYRP
jgi:cytochrome P450